jgi:hypothetical protein
VPNTGTKGFSLLSGLGFFGLKEAFTVLRKVIEYKRVSFEK